MNDLNDISKKIESTLSCLDAVDKKHVDPFFYTRLSQRLEETKQIPGFIQWFTFAPIAKPAFVAALLVINLFTAWHYLNYNQDSQTENLTNNALIQSVTSDTTYTASNELYLIFNEDE